jgi:hypothetical protein
VDLGNILENKCSCDKLLLLDSLNDNTKAQSRRPIQSIDVDE